MSQNEDATSTGDVKQWYVVYLNEDEELVGTHGGPYPPMKAREVRDGMQSDIERGNYSDWSIPQDADSAKMVCPEKYEKLKRKMLGVEDAN